MSLLYADTSAIIRAYLSDEPDHELLRSMILEGPEPVVTSELTRIEVARAARVASRAGRMRRSHDVEARFEADTADDGAIDLLVLRPDVVLPTAHRLVRSHSLRTLDAIHLAVAVEECSALSGDWEFVTRDVDQAAAASALGITVR